MEDNKKPNFDNLFKIIKKNMPKRKPIKKVKIEKLNLTNKDQIKRDKKFNELKMSNPYLPQNKYYNELRKLFIYKHIKNLSQVKRLLNNNDKMSKKGILSKPSQKKVDEIESLIKAHLLEGGGIFDIIKKGFSKVSDFYSSETGTKLKNLIPSSDKNATQSFIGEKHAILKLPTGGFGVASFMGPNTQVIKRIQRGDKPRTKSDAVAEKHDIAYALASNEPTKELQLKAIRDADNKMIESLNKIERDNSDFKQNILLGRELIKGKVLLEDINLLDKNKFAGQLEKLSPSDLALLKNKQLELTREGYGKPAIMILKKLKKYNPQIQKIILMNELKKISKIKNKKIKNIKK